MRRSCRIYQSDEKCNFVFTATGFRDLFTLITKANNPVTFRKTPKDLPLLFISGDKDPVGRYGEWCAPYGQSVPRQRREEYRGHLFIRMRATRCSTSLTDLKPSEIFPVGWRHTLPQELQGRLSSRSRKRQRNKNKTSLKRLREVFVLLGAGNRLAMLSALEIPCIEHCRDNEQHACDQQG